MQIFGLGSNEYLVLEVSDWLLFLLMSLSRPAGKNRSPQARPRQPLLTSFLPKSLERAAAQRTWRSSQPAGLGQGWRGRAYSERFFNAHVLSADWVSFISSCF